MARKPRGKEKEVAIVGKVVLGGGGGWGWTEMTIVALFVGLVAAIR